MSGEGDLALDAAVLGEPLRLPCGLVLKNRLAKSAMSDSLGDGAGGPTAEQIALYQRWSDGGAGLSLIGEVQVDPRFPENPGNLVLSGHVDDTALRPLAATGSAGGATIWPQLGHAGALAYGPLAHRAGPSELDLDELRCDALTVDDIGQLPELYASASVRAQSSGFSGVQIHAGHGFLLSQFLSPLFNRREDGYGGPIEARCRILLEIVTRTRRAVGSEFAIAIRINSSDGLEGGLSEDDALAAMSLLGAAGVDLFDISGGTYFPGAPSSSDRRTDGPYFVDFAQRARTVTDTPLMVTGGFQTLRQAVDAVANEATDLVGLARTMVLDPDLPSKWLGGRPADPEFPRFESPPPNGITAWFTMRLAALAAGEEARFDLTLGDALAAYEARDAQRVAIWEQAFERGG